MPTAAEIRAELERRKKAAPPPAAPTGNKPDPEAIKAELARRGVASQPSFFQRQGQRMVTMGTPQQAAPSAPDPNAPNPITTAMRQSTAQVNSQFAAQKAEEERRRQERTIFNSASPGLAFRDTGSKGTVELNDDGGDFGKGMRILPIHAQRAAVGAAEAALNTPGDLAAVATVPYAMSFDPEMQGIMAGSEFGVGADTLLERIAGRVKSGGFDKMQQTLDNAPRFDFSAAKIPVPESEQSFTGALAEGFMQYLIARGAVGKFAPGGKLPTQVAKDVAATGLGFSGNTPRLADMLDPESMGFAADYIRWLKSQPGETGLVGRVKNMAEDTTLNLIGMGIFRGAKASADAMSPQALTPTNAGGARLGPVTPQPSVAPPVAPAPIPQGPPRMAQAGPAGAGQQPPAGPATLQATPRNVAPAVSREEIAVARDTAKAVSRFMRGARVPGHIVNDYVGSLLSRYEPLKSDRYPLAFFIEEDLPQYLQSRGYSPAEARNLAGDVAAKTDGWGQAAHSFNASGNSSRYTMQDTIHQLTTTQKDELEGTFKAVLGDETLAGKSDDIVDLMQRNGQEAYNNSLSEANRLLRSQKATPEQAGAVAEMVMLMKTPAYRELVPESWAIEATTTGRSLDDLIDAKIADDPIGTAHLLQSEIGEVARGAKNIDGTPNKASSAYETRRKALLDRLEKFNGYKGARQQHGDLYGAKDSVTFGDRFLSVAKSEFATEQMARDLAKLSPRQQQVAALSIRDALLNPLLRTSPEDASARIAQLQNEGTLKALVTVLGPERGNELRNAIANMRVENQRIARVNQNAGSPTNLKQQGGKDAIDNIRGPINRTVHGVGNPGGWAMAVGADLAFGTGGAITATKAAGSLVDKLSTPGRRFQSRVTKGLYGLPARQADDVLPALDAPDVPPAGQIDAPPATGAPVRKTKGPPKPRAPRPPVTPDEWQKRIQADQDELQRLLRAYDEIDRTAPDVDDLMRANLHKQSLARRRIADKTKKLEAARNAPVPAEAAAPATTAPRRPPEQAGFGGAPTKGGNGTVSRIVAGGVVGGMAGTFAGEADAQSAETMAELDRARKEREDVLAILADLQEQQKFFATATEKELQKRLDREGFDLGPTGADGTIGPRTREAINGRKAEIEKEAKAARERLASADSNLQKWEQQAAFEKTRPTDAQQAFRDYAPLLGGIAGALGAKTARLGGSGISKLTATNHIKKSNALLNNAPIAPPKTAAQRAAVRAELDRRATSLNEFWQRGGAKTNVPFATKRDGSWEARPPKNVTPPAGLFPDKFIGRNVGAADVLIGGTGAIEAGLAWQNSEVIKEKLKSAIEVAKDKPTEANLARVQELEDQYAQAKAWMMLGAGVAAGTSIGVFTSKYASKRANVAKAEEELAILRRAIADLKKPSAASSKAAKPPSAPLPLASAPQAMLPAPASPPTPPLPPSRPRRRP